jgi:DNA repair exonuclease SbcCD nuclease subunit
MHKVLRIGDPHIQVSNLKDSEKLMNFVIETAKLNEVHSIEFLGDLFHTHAVKRIEVEDFWCRTFNLIQSENIRCRVLIGNHDQVGSKEKEQLINSLNVFGDTDLRTIINEPQILYNIAYIPYHSDHEQFLKAAQDLYDQGARELLIAHQTFTGAQYENGFFSEEGIDPALVPQKQIISGHIHKSQQVGKCFYPGTPKWDTMSDANQAKGIWIFTHNENGEYIDKEFVSTENIVTPIISYEIKEGNDIPIINPSARNYITLEGKTAWLNKIKKDFKNCNIKIKPTDRSVGKINTNVSIDEYLENQFNPIANVSKQEIKDFLRNI